MKKIIIIVLAVSFGYSCSSDSKPKGILSEDKMVEVLVDIHMAEGMASSLSIPFDSSKKIYPLLEKEVFRKHQIADSVYMESFQYYLRDSRKMESIYARTIDSLALKEKIGDQ
ncbi:MAG: DUF4296 domain-containing protein [Anditalea sp.]